MNETSFNSRTLASVELRLQRFHLPPVESALAVGKRAPIGPRALEKALVEIMPEQFERIDVDHEIIEALLMNKSHLRRVPRERLVSLIVRHAERLMDATEILHVSMDIELSVAERLEL